MSATIEIGFRPDERNIRLRFRKIINSNWRLRADDNRFSQSASEKIA